MRDITEAQTPDCSSHTFRYHPGAHLHHSTAGSSQELGHHLSCCRAPSTPVISAAMVFYHQRLKSHVFRLQSKDCLYSLWGKLSPQDSLFLAVCRFGITSGLYYLSPTTRKFLFFLNNEFLDDAVEETATRKACWFAKPAQYSPVWLYRDWGFSGPWALDTAQQGVYLGNKPPSTIQSSFFSSFLLRHRR